MGLLVWKVWNMWKVLKNRVVPPEDQVGHVILQNIYAFSDTLKIIVLAYLDV